jgi:hypothetical protein
MSIRTLLCLSVSAVVLSAAAGLSTTTARGAAPSNSPAAAAQPANSARGEGQGRAGPGARGGRGGAPTTPVTLSSAMGDMNRMLRALKAEASDPAKAEQTLTDLVNFQRDVAVSKAQLPPAMNRLPADQKAKSIASYRAMMNGLTRTLLDLEDAVNDKKPDEIKKLLAKLDEFEKQGHAEFRPNGD